MMQRLQMPFVYLTYTAVYGLLIWGAIRFHFGSWAWLYGHLEIVGVAGTGAFFAINRVADTSRRPFTHVPFDAHWWEFLIFGVTTSIFGIVTVLSLVCIVVIVPILIPLKLLQVYILGSGATLLSALIAFPLVYALLSLSFAGIYLWLLVKGKGNLVRKGEDLYSGRAGEGWPFQEAYYFSLSTMVKGTPLYEGSGWCRWVALAEIAVARILEIGMVTVGIGAILKRGAGPHP